jgi:hypothetical protein
LSNERWMTDTPVLVKATGFEHDLNRSPVRATGNPQRSHAPRGILPVPA